MYVCLCRGVTNQVVSEAVSAGALTSKQVAQACGAGAECGRCRNTIRSIIASSQTESSEVDKGKPTPPMSKKQ